jgi:hypothetical protein
LVCGGYGAGIIIRNLVPFTREEGIMTHTEVYYSLCITFHQYNIDVSRTKICLLVVDKSILAISNMSWSLGGSFYTQIKS